MAAIFFRRAMVGTDTTALTVLTTIFTLQPTPAPTARLRILL